MRILQVVHGFQPEFVGGTEQYCEALSRRLLRHGHECMVLAGSDRSATEATMTTVDQDGLLVTRYLRAQGRPRRWTEEYDPEAEGLTRRLLALVKPDVVHLHHWQRLTNNLVAICGDMRIPAVVTMHDVWTSCPRINRIRWDGAFCTEPPAAAPCLICAERGPWQNDQEIMSALTLRREMMSLELGLAVTVLAPSQAHRAFTLDLLDLAEHRLTVLPHGSLPPVTARREGARRLEFPNRPLHIGHWGYLMYLKGTHLLLEAVRQLRDPTSVQVHLIGTSTDLKYEEWLQELARGISVQFHGAYQAKDLQAFDLDLAVFPSIASESYSFVLDEALHLGLPVIVADRGALPERIGTAGLTFKAGDAADLARQLQAILDAPEIMNTMRRGIRLDGLYSMEGHVKMVEKIYEDAVHSKKPKRKVATPYLKLIAHAQQQVSEREEALVELQRQATFAQARAQEQEAERAAEARARHAAETRCAELEARLAAHDATAAALAQEREMEKAHLQAELGRLAQERTGEGQARSLADQRAEELATRLLSIENAHGAQVQELERAIGALAGDRDGLLRRLAELEQTPAVRLQALLGKLSRGGK